jgi:2-(1,2-epoxy-1,2-dihydrophenyl)acetyl-CoA isomerase
VSIVEVTRDTGIARLRLNRPKVHNAWTAEMGDLVTATVDALGRDDSVRVVVLCGEGRSFCSGVDLRGHFDYNADGIADLRGMHYRRFMPAILALRRLAKPVIAEVKGACVGYGCSLAMASDFVLMGQSSIMIFAFARLGLLPDGGATAMLVDRVGPLRAAEIAMLARDISSDEALNYGLVSRVVADDQLEAATLELARQLACGPTRSYGAIKEAIQAWMADGITRQMDREGELLQRLAATSDFVEGKAAFVERRQASFTGS